MGIDPKRSLQIKFPQVANQWHPSLNGDLTPKDISAHSHKKVWWQCLKGHEWESKVQSRTNRNGGCPYCSGHYVAPENSLAYLFPKISKEWHPIKNGNFQPKDVTKSSGKKVWWQCLKGHEWEASISKRTRIDNPTGCPKCSNQSSAPEVRILSELESVFDKVVSREKINNQEIDIFLPDFLLGIEYDGSFYHERKENRDLEKNKLLKQKGITLIRIREKPLKRIDPRDIIINRREIKKEDINQLLRSLIQNKLITEDKILKNIKNYFQENQFLNEELYRKYIECFPSPLPGKSLQENNSKLSEEFDLTKNYPLKPSNFNPSSNQKVWWLCPENHSYEATIDNRNGNGSGCPYCSGKLVTSKNSLATCSPKVAKNWHPTKNFPLIPDDVVNGSNQKVWWQCSKGHEWEGKIANRTRKTAPAGCPYCSGFYVAQENSLTTLFPLISEEWHPIKNGDLEPNDFTKASGKKVWWQCVKGHEWEEKIQKRTMRGYGCPYCSGKRVTPENSLKTLSPEVAKEWHSRKNGLLKPYEVANASGKKAWWKCLFCSHEWESIIANRTKEVRPTGCPQCWKKRQGKYQK